MNTANPRGHVENRAKVSVKLLLLDCRLLRNVDTVQEFTDILGPYTAYTLDGRGFGDVSEMESEQSET